MNFFEKKRKMIVLNRRRAMNANEKTLHNFSFWAWVLFIFKFYNSDDINRKIKRLARKINIA